MGPTVDKPEPQFTAQQAVVMDEETRRPVIPGSGIVGRVARTGRIPLGYHKDPAKSATTFVEWDGRRWSLTGDMATVAADDTITLLGRGSLCINTGGEKVYPEEVEGVLRRVAAPSTTWWSSACPTSAGVSVWSPSFSWRPGRSPPRAS